MTKKKIPISKALIWIFLSTLLVSGSATLGWLYYLHLLKMSAQDDDYRIIAVVQAGQKPETLKTIYLAELMELSIDQPTNLYLFDTKKARDKLLVSPVIKEAWVRRVKPGTVYVEYVTRKPRFFLVDCDNAAIDDQGVPFPVHPFYTPKKLPELCLGSDDVQWGKPLSGNYYQLACALYEYLSEMADEKMTIRRVDVSNAYALSYGQREIVIILDELVLSIPQKRFLRFDEKYYQQAIANYMVLREYLRDQQHSMVIDLRLPQLAFMNEEGKTKN